MKRASYRDAIDWIAQNDEAGIGHDALDPDTVAELVTAVLIADIFGVLPEKVGADIVRRRIKLARAAIAKAESTEALGQAECGR